MSAGCTLGTPQNRGTRYVQFLAQHEAAVVLERLRPKPDEAPTSRPLGTGMNALAGANYQKVLRFHWTTAPSLPCCLVKRHCRHDLVRRDRDECRARQAFTDA